MIRSEWDSEHFGVEFWRFDGSLGGLSSFDFADARVPVASPLVGELQEQGFRYVETRLRLEASRPPDGWGYECDALRVISPHDAADIASRAFAYSGTRFHAEPMLAERADLLYARWALSLGDTHTLLTLRDGGCFLAVSDGCERLMLGAVDPSRMGEGLAYRLWSSAIAQFDPPLVKADVLAHNAPVLNLYRKLRHFNVIDAEVTLHARG